MRIIALVVVVAVLLFFALRPIISKIPELHEFLARVDAQQLSWWSRIRVLVKGVKTEVVARMIGVVGVILPGLQFFDFVDFSTILPPINIMEGWSIPATMYVPAVLAPALTWVMTKLRAASDGPAGVNTFLVEPEKLPDAIVKPAADLGAESTAAIATVQDDITKKADSINAAREAVLAAGLSWPDLKPIVVPAVVPPSTASAIATDQKFT